MHPNLDPSQQFLDDGKRSAKFGTTISRSTAVPEAQAARKTIFQTAPSHQVTEQYRALAGEIEARIREFEGEGLVVPGEARAANG